MQVLPKPTLFIPRPIIPTAILQYDSDSCGTFFNKIWAFSVSYRLFGTGQNGSGFRTRFFGSDKKSKPKRAQTIAQPLTQKTKNQDLFHFLSIPLHLTLIVIIKPHYQHAIFRKHTWNHRKHAFSKTQ